MVAACDRGAAARRGLDRCARVRAPARENARRSIVLERDVAAGAALVAEDLGFKRPGTGIPPFEAERVVGDARAATWSEGTVLSESDIE